MARGVWQIAAGETGREYSQLFLDHDLMFMGPGWFGAYNSDKYNEAVDKGEITAQKCGMVRSFAERVVPGDIVLLRKVHRVAAVGVVVEDDDGGNGYRHDENFGDVYGWSLEHTRRVMWQAQSARELKRIQADGELFAAYKQQHTFTRVRDQETLDRIAPLIPKCVERPLRSRPDQLPPVLNLDELGQKLFSKGLANDAVDNVLRAIERQRRLLTWYDAQGKESQRPDEHEVVAHMVLPLLLAMGWSEQLLAVEWNKVDLAAFWRTPTTAERCVLVCEAKRMRHGLQNVRDQALNYVKIRKLTGCRKILLTQGARFYLYDRVDGAWPADAEPTGYINLERIRENHIAPANTNAVETLMALTPAGVSRAVGKDE
ncbi:MAG: hypothetical protein ACYSVY_08085 [Planctomycetota bacterium]|jgi:hypothetical protein